MLGYFLRRRKLGNTSTKGILSFSKKITDVYRNDHALPNAQDLLCIRWGCTSNTPQKNVLNTAKAIHEVSDKKTFRLRLSEAGLAPKTTGTVAEWMQKYGTFPVVLRPAVHAQGRHVYLCNNAQELQKAAARFANYYVSEFIDKKEEYRVFVCQGRAVWVAKKTPGNPEDVAWNVARGGRFDNVRWSDWPCKAVKTAIKAFNLSDLDFGGVDVMVDDRGGCTVLEINAAPSQTSSYRQECVAKVFDYILENGKKERIPVREDVKGLYLKFIHPALERKAIV